MYVIILESSPRLLHSCHVHREYRYKDNVTMVENGTKVLAYNTKSFVFLRDRSVGDPTVDYITTVNIPVWVSHELKVPDSLSGTCALLHPFRF